MLPESFRTNLGWFKVMERFYKELKLLLKKYNVRLYCGDHGLIAKIKVDRNWYSVNIDDINVE